MPPKRKSRVMKHRRSTRTRTRSKRQGGIHPNAYHHPPTASPSPVRGGGTVRRRRKRRVRKNCTRRYGGLPLPTKKEAVRRIAEYAMKNVEGVKTTAANVGKGYGHLVSSAFFNEAKFFSSVFAMGAGRSMMRETLQWTEPTVVLLNRLINFGVFNKVHFVINHKNENGTDISIEHSFLKGVYIIDDVAMILSTVGDNPSYFVLYWDYAYMFHIKKVHKVNERTYEIINDKPVVATDIPVVATGTPVVTTDTPVVDSVAPDSNAQAAVVVNDRDSNAQAATNGERLGTIISTAKRLGLMIPKATLQMLSSFYGNKGLGSIAIKAAIDVAIIATNLIPKKLDNSMFHALKMKIEPTVQLLTRLCDIGVLCKKNFVIDGKDYLDKTKKQVAIEGLETIKVAYIVSDIANTRYFVLYWGFLSEFYIKEVKISSDGSEKTYTVHTDDEVDQQSEVV